MPEPILYAKERDGFKPQLEVSLASARSNHFSQIKVKGHYLMEWARASIKLWILYRIKNHILKRVLIP